MLQRLGREHVQLARPRSTRRHHQGEISIMVVITIRGSLVGINSGITRAIGIPIRDHVPIAPSSNKRTTLIHNPRLRTVTYGSIH